ncbi:M12 family metallo-peptidase [Elongatibacter sediminis]|uniref:M12 family metallo-peptidase n=1 Tax=Elongatibacter sediminis TaxID=3119006 RepID=A0AAW9R7N2_9GAMM
MKGISRFNFGVLLAVFTYAGVYASEHPSDSDELLRTPPAGPLTLAPEREDRGIAAGIIPLSTQESLRLLRAAPGTVVRLTGLESHLASDGKPVPLRRYEPFAPGAVVHLVSASGSVTIDPRNRRYFLAGTAQEGVGIAIDPSSGEISGYAVRGSSRVQLSGFAGIGIEVNPVDSEPEGANECGTLLDHQTPEVQESVFNPPTASRSEAPQGATLSFEAVVAVDTDTEWMAGKGNDPATATDWITDLFLAMNVFYERDIETRLLIGDVILRTGSDPYSVPSNRSDQLDEFGEYWRVNMAATERNFAAMLSGRGISAGSFSGIAWIDVYCNKGQQWGQRTVGSYSFNAIGSSRTPGNTALYVGHEIGHNLGSPHTHCYSPEVDQCYNGESDCYTGPPSCPAGGKGTVMSYCHVSGSSGAGCGTNKQEFHPTVQSLLESRLAANSPSCIAPWQPAVEEMVHSSGFETP